jgi:hypothetical protein
MSIDTSTDLLASDEVIDIESLHSQEDLEEMFSAGVGTKKKIWILCGTYRTPEEFHKKMAPVGTLKQGVHFFNVQRNVPPRVSFRQYWNTWWMQVVQDDQGNKNVWVSVVFCAEGANGKPVPNLRKQ